MGLVSSGCHSHLLWENIPENSQTKVEDNFLQNTDSAVQQNETGYIASYMLTNIFHPLPYLYNTLFKSYRDILVKTKLEVSPIIGPSL